MSRREATLPPGLADAFDVLRQLGAGAMGAVFLARDRTLERDVAIKLMLPTTVAQVRQRFLREAAVLARLKHPNILAIYDYGVSGDVPYLVMEYLEGSSLEDDPPGLEAVDVMLEVASALEEVHRQELVHRDVKPANILRSRDGRTVLADFGLVQDPGQTALTRTGGIVGSIGFLAPEGFKGEASSATDWFAWGVCLYRLIEKRLPFDKDEVMLGVAQGRVPEPSFHRINPETPLAAAIRACLRADPGERPASREELELLLERSLTAPEEPDASPPSSTPHPLRPLALATAAAALLAGLVLPISGVRPPAPPPPGGGDLEVSSTPVANHPFGPGYEDQVTADLDEAELLLLDEDGQVVPAPDGVLPEAWTPLLGGDPEAWGRAVRRLPSLARFHTWIAEGGRPEELPEEARARLRTLDTRFQVRGLPRPFFPYVHVGPSTVPAELPGSAGGRMARGWLATAALAHTRLQVHLLRYRAEYSQMRRGKYPGEAPPAVTATITYRLVQDEDFGDGVRDLYRVNDARGYVSRWLREGREELRVVLFALGVSMRREPETRELAATFGRGLSADQSALWYGPLAYEPWTSALGGPPSHPAAWSVQAVHLGVVGGVQRRSRWEDRSLPGSLFEAWVAAREGGDEGAGAARRARQAAAFMLPGALWDHDRFAEIVPRAREALAWVRGPPEEDMAWFWLLRGADTASPPVPLTPEEQVAGRAALIRLRSLMGGDSEDWIAAYLERNPED